MSCFRAGPLSLYAFMAIFLVGCGGSSKLNPVKGVVLLKGQPLSGATVTLVSAGADSATKDFPTGTTKEDGTFSVSTGGVAGAPAGSYKVTIAAMQPSADKGEGMAVGGLQLEDRLKGAYSNPSASTISIEVKPGDNELPPIQLQ
jgi:hypothetical protein